MRVGRLWGVVSLAALLFGAAAFGEEPPDVAKRVRAVLARCVGCHSGGEPKGGLDLTTREGALRGGENGEPALVAGDPDASPIVEQTASRLMPPKRPLAEVEVAVLRDWIRSGAAWSGGPITKAEAPADPAAVSGQWAFRAITKPPAPSVSRPDWVKDPIDAFVLARLDAAGLKPAAPADRATYLRRVTFDLIGLPPTPEELEAFETDRRPDAYERVVDRLLASPGYGERWGRHWLDVARFAESHGFEYDRIREHAWRYRDWVIRTLNGDVPYGEFVRKQIAGDRIEPVTPDGIAATGFLVAGPWDEAGNGQVSVVMRERVREEELEDTVAAVGQTFLGLTVNCARCHDHKFDPILQRDYYRLKSAVEGAKHGTRPMLSPAELKAREAETAGLKEKANRLAAEISEIERPAREAILRDRGGLGGAGPVRPTALWTFETDARDAIGGLDTALQGGAIVAEGRLKLAKRGAYLQSSALGRELREKTIEAWVALTDPDQRGGGVVCVEATDGSGFDAIVYGENDARKWIAGSEFYRRTNTAAARAEDAPSGRLIHLAITYGLDDRITLYRNGVPYFGPYKPEKGDEGRLRTYAAGASRVLLGLRHTGAGNGFLIGEVEEARVYDRALTSEDVAASFRAGPVKIGEAELAAALADEARSRRDGLAQDLADVRRRLREVEPVPLAYAATPIDPTPTRILARGDAAKPGEEVAAGGLSAVETPSPEFGLKPDSPEGPRRAKLAEWIADPANPLIWRVIVNRLWHHHFGTGIVATPNDFGVNGDRPSHPELLDGLAGDLLVGGGRLKSVQRRIVLSSTYRQASTYDAKASGVDGECRLVWRFPPRRLEAESIRDAMLAVSGRLNPEMGGPSFRPFTVTTFNSNFYNLFESDDAPYVRRTVYRININSAKNPLLEALDCPDPSVKTPRRSATVTPLQALGLMNNGFVRRRAEELAARATREAGGGDEAVERVYRLALGRSPNDAERARAVAVAREHGLATMCWAVLNSSEFLYLR